MSTERILITKEGRVIFVNDTSRDFHTKFGYIKKDDLKKKSGAVSTNINNEMYILTPGFIDFYKKIKRGAQIMMLKDLGTIAAETGINSKSRVVDAGSGSGAAAIFFGNIAKEVTSYEIRKDFIEIVNKNVELLKMRNIKLKNKDVCEGIDETDVDLISLDLPEPWRVIKHAEKALKPGGFLVSYNPQLTQVREFVEEIRRNKNFIYLRTIENIQREWEIDEKRLRPKNTEIGHTGFLSFARKIA